MSFLQDDLMDTILDSIWGSGTPTTFYIALLQTSPATDGTGAVEANYTGYARFPVTNDATNFPAASGGLKTNATSWDFGVAGSGPQDVVSFAFLDDPTAPVSPTTLTAVVDLTSSPVTITNGADVHFAVGTVDLTNCL